MAALPKSSEPPMEKPGAPSRGAAVIEEPNAAAAPSAAAACLDCLDASPFPFPDSSSSPSPPSVHRSVDSYILSSQGRASAGTRKRKAPAGARKPKLQDQPIQIPVCYRRRKMPWFSLVRTIDDFLVQGDDLDACMGGGFECPHVIGELPPQPWLMSLVDLKTWIFKLFRLHPETQDLVVWGFFKQHTIDRCDERSPDWYLEYIPWDNHYFTDDRCWRSFARKLKRKRNVVPKFMLYVESSEIRHYDILLKSVNDDYSAVLPEKECLTAPHLGFIRCSLEYLAMTATDLAACLSDHSGKQISPPEAWRARQYALEREFGTFFESYNIAPRLLKSIVRANHGGFVDIKGIEVDGCEDYQVLHRMFWAFAQCLQAFQHCRPVLCVKGTPLYGKYQGVLLTALAFDANDYSVPVAFAVVEDETKESWLWFLRNLERALVKRSNVCIIHDYKTELIDAVKDLLSSPQTPCIWKDSRWCMEHLAENFLAYFGDEKLMMMFKKLCQERQLHTFRELWKQLDELTSKYMTERDCGAIVEMQQIPVEHDEAYLEAQSPCNQPDSMEDKDEGDCAGYSKRKITKFSDWIRLKPNEKWSLLFDRNGARYGIMGNNIADMYKHDIVLMGITYLPLLGIARETFSRMVKYFENTSASAKKAIADPSMNFPERVQDDMNSEMQKAQMHRVICMDRNKGNVFGEKQVESYMVQSRQKNVIVHLNTHSMNRSRVSIIRKVVACSCKKLQLLHKPCSHVNAVCCELGISTATYMSRYYSLAYLGSTWRGEFNQPGTSCYDIGFMRSERGTTWIPDKRLESSLPVFVTSNCVQTSPYEEDQRCNN